MKTYLVKEEWAPMWRTMATAIDDAQKWTVEAHGNKDMGKFRIFSKMVADRVSAMGNLQRIAFGELLEQLSRDRGRVAIHTKIQTEPPGMVVYDSDEEFYAEAKEFHEEGKRDNEPSMQAFGMTSLKRPIEPLNPEGLD